MQTDDGIGEEADRDCTERDPGHLPWCALIQLGVQRRDVDLVRVGRGACEPGDVCAGA